MIITAKLQRGFSDENKWTGALRIPALKPTDEALGLRSELFALLRPSLLLPGQTADETGRRLHLVPAALGVLQQRLIGGEDRQTAQWLDVSVCPSGSLSLSSESSESL